jgi:hypothetical protein
MAVSMKSSPNLELAIVHLDSPHAFEKKLLHYTRTDGLFEISVIEIPNMIFIVISPTHKRTERRAPVWGSEFTSKDAAQQGGGGSGKLLLG